MPSPAVTTFREIVHDTTAPVPSAGTEHQGSSQTRPAGIGAGGH